MSSVLCLVKSLNWAHVYNFRLQFYDRNSLVESAVNDLQPDLYSMNTPDPLSYKDINTQSPVSDSCEPFIVSCNMNFMDVLYTLQFACISL